MLKYRTITRDSITQMQMVLKLIRNKHRYCMFYAKESEQLLGSHAPKGLHFKITYCHFALSRTYVAFHPPFRISSCRVGEISDVSSLSFMVRGGVTRFTSWPSVWGKGGWATCLTKRKRKLWQYQLRWQLKAMNNSTNSSTVGYYTNGTSSFTRLEKQLKNVEHFRDSRYCGNDVEPNRTCTQNAATKTIQ